MLCPPLAGAGRPFRLGAHLLLAALCGAASIPDAAAAWVAVREKAPEPPREFRACWVASVYNIDWPSRPGLSAAQQQRELLNLLDRAAALHLNAVILQVRPACDALYASRLEPWSAFLTGSMGRPPSPAYDPLAFAVQEAHRRGLELHAWFNPFRALVNSNGGVASNHVTRTRPEAVRSYNNQKWLDPGDPWVQKHSLSVMLDVVRRYDIDAVHIDDYFYPYPEKKNGRALTSFPDEATYRKYGGRQDRGDWRRANIDRFVSDLYKGIKGEKAWVKFGVSPFGIWRPGTPRGIEAGLDAYDDLYADSRKWLQSGWVDYFSPQLYWKIDPPEQSFPALLSWWEGQSGKGRHVWPGMASDRVGSGGDGRSASEIIRQIDLARRVLGAGESGHSHWNAKALMTNKGGVADQLARGPYAGKALVPACPWLGKGEPGQPAVRVDGGDQPRITVEPGRGATPRWWVVQVTDRGGRDWRIDRVLPGDARQIGLSSAPAAIAVRGVSAAGLTGPAVVLRP